MKNVFTNTTLGILFLAIFALGVPTAYAASVGDLVPTNVTQNKSGSKNVVTWNKPSGNRQVSSYQVYRGQVYRGRDGADWVRVATNVKTRSWSAPYYSGDVFAVRAVAYIKRAQ